MHKVLKLTLLYFLQVWKIWRRTNGLKKTNTYFDINVKTFFLKSRKARKYLMLYNEVLGCKPACYLKALEGNSYAQNIFQPQRKWWNWSLRVLQWCVLWSQCHLHKVSRVEQSQWWDRAGHNGCFFTLLPEVFMNIFDLQINDSIFAAGILNGEINHRGTVSDFCTVLRISKFYWY